MDEDIYRRNIGLGNKIEVITPEGEKKIEIMPLGLEYLPDILAIQESFGSVKGETEIAKVMAREDVSKRMAKIVEATINESLPDKDKKYKDFVAMKNFLLLITEILKINDLGVSGVEAVKKKLNQIEKVKEGGKSTNPS